MISHVLCILSCAISRQSTPVKVQTYWKNEQLARIGELIFKEKFGNNLGKKTTVVCGLCVVGNKSKS